jgi:hypothetical protein
MTFAVGVFGVLVCLAIDWLVQLNILHNYPHTVKRRFCFTLVQHLAAADLSALRLILNANMTSGPTDLEHKETYDRHSVAEDAG